MLLTVTGAVLYNDVIADIRLFSYPVGDVLHSFFAIYGGHLYSARFISTLPSSSTKIIKDVPNEGVIQMRRGCDQWRPLHLNLAVF